MNAYELPDGRVLIPKRAEGPDGLIGDGLVVATEAEAVQWAPWTVPATAALAKHWRSVDER